MTRVNPRTHRALKADDAVARARLNDAENGLPVAFAVAAAVVQPEGVRKRGDVMACASRDVHAWSRREGGQ